MGSSFSDRLKSGEIKPPAAELVGFRMLSFADGESRFEYLRPVFEEKLFARAKVVHRGRTVGLVECDITTEDGKLVARAVSTCSVLRGEKAEGR